MGDKKTYELGADCYFRKGRNDHVACQDYSLVGKAGVLAKEEVWAVIADGCSSSIHTDVGARILTWAAKNTIEQFPQFNEDDYYVAVMADAFNISKAMGVPVGCLDATLLTARVSDGNIRVSLYGDGFVMVRYNDGRIKGFQCVYPNNFPRYLSYSIDNDRATQRDKVGGLGYASPFSISPSGILVLGEQIPIEKHFDYTCPISEGAEALFLASDGLGQFGGLTDKTYRPYEKIVPGVTGIKGYAGQFVQRRAIKFLDKECVDAGIMPFDDISVAAISFKEITPNA